MPFEVLIYENSPLDLQGNVNLYPTSKPPRFCSHMLRGRSHCGRGSILRNISKKHTAEARGGNALAEASAEAAAVFTEAMRKALRKWGFTSSRSWAVCTSCDCPMRGSFFATLHAPTFCLVFQRIRFHVRCFSVERCKPPCQTGSQCPCRIFRCCWWTTALTAGKACTVAKTQRCDYVQQVLV